LIDALSLPLTIPMIVDASCPPDALPEDAADSPGEESLVAGSFIPQPETASSRKLIERTDARIFTFIQTPSFSIYLSL
jgi:hypothetical protein